MKLTLLAHSGHVDSNEEIPETAASFVVVVCLFILLLATSSPLFHPSLPLALDPLFRL